MDALMVSSLGKRKCEAGWSHPESLGLGLADVNKDGNLQAKTILTVSQIQTISPDGTVKNRRKSH